MKVTDERTHKNGVGNDKCGKFDLGQQDEWYNAKVAFEICNQSSLMEKIGTQPKANKYEHF